MPTQFIRMACVAAVVVVLTAAAPGQGQVVAEAVVGLAGGGPPSGTARKGGLHLPQGRNVSFNYVMTDGGGFRWDIQYYGTVAQGTNYAYSGGMYCQVNGSNVRSNTGQGWVNATGDEIEIGPHSGNSLKIYRRIRVYKDQSLARWLDIFENPTGQAITIQLQYYSYVNYGIQRMVSESGQASFATGDRFFVTETRQSGNNTPSLLHVVCGKRAKLQPSVQIQGNSVYFRYRLTVPANKTVLLCHFESQDHGVETLLKRGKALRAYQLLRDLSPGVRQLILNFPVSFGFADIDLDRTETADQVILANGDPVLGTVTNKSFTIGTFYGDIEVPADKVLGMVPIAGESERVRVLMVDGQVVSGEPADKSLTVALASGGGTLSVPLNRVRQWSYRISDSRPAEVTFAGPVAVLRTGDRLTFDAAKTELSFRTRHGVVRLEAKDLLEVSLDNTGNAVHRVVFLNGSRLAGFLEPEQVELALRLGPKLLVPRDRIVKMVFASEEQPDQTLTRLVLTNEDELFGELADEGLTVKTEYGAVSVRPRNVRAMAFDGEQVGRLVLQLWDGTVLRGRLEQEGLLFVLAGGAKLNVHVGQVQAIVRSQALPPDDVRKRVEQLVAQLGAESYRDREAAMKALLKMGAGVAPLLKKHAANDDPEVRQRIEEILERLGGADGGAGPPLPEEFIQLQVRD